MSRRHPPARPKPAVPPPVNMCESSSQISQCDSLRRNYRPLPSCQEILCAPSNKPNSKADDDDDEREVAANSVRLVNRFITNNNTESDRQKSSSVHRRHKDNNSKLSTKPTESSTSNVKRSPKRQTVLTKQSRNVPESSSKSNLDQTPPTRSSGNPQPRQNSQPNSVGNVRNPYSQFHPPRAQTFNELNERAHQNQTFPTEASFLFAEETALLTSENHYPSNQIKFCSHSGSGNSTRTELRHQGVDINHLSQLQPPISTQNSHRTSPASITSPATSSSSLLQRLATSSNNNCNSSDRSLTTPSPFPQPHIDDNDDEETLSSSDFTNYGGESNTIYSTSEYDDEIELEQQRELLDYENYLQQHAPAQPSPTFEEFAPNISVLAQQHDRRVQNHSNKVSLQSSTHTVCAQEELQPYETSFQQLLGAFENQFKRQETFVAMDGKTHILEQTHQQHSSLPSGMMANSGVAEVQPTRTGDRHIALQQMRSLSFPSQHHQQQQGTALNLQSNTSTFVNGGDTVDGQSLQQSMMNIESSLHRLNEAGGDVSANHIASDNRNFPPNTHNATSQSWAAGQQTLHNPVMLDPCSSSMTQHQDFAPKTANRPYSTALLSRMLTSCHQAFTAYPKKPNGPGALTGVSQANSTATLQPVQPVDPWEIPFDAIKSLEWKGAGAQGAVFVGSLGGQRVAVKKVCTLREVEEIRPFRRLQHKNIIRLLGVCTQELCYSIVMEYCQFGSLYDYIQEHNRILPEQLLSFTKQIAAGMHYLHTNKIIHRDLKSPNVLLSDNHTVKISDFGTSKFATTSTTSLSQDDATDESGKKSPTTTIAANAAAKTWSFVGTVSWMAPEVIRSEAQNEKVDTWAFGVILWEMLFGLPPYPGVEDASAIMWGVGSEILTLPIPDNVPQGLRLLMLQCWSSKPRNRPTFKNIQIHVDIAAPDVLEMLPQYSSEGGEQQELSTAVSAYAVRQDQWREQIMTMLHKEVDSALKHSPRVLKAQELAILEQRKKELRHAQDIRMHYERKLERANNLYLEMTTCMLQLEQRERELVKREQRLSAFLNKDGRPKLAKRRILKAMLGSNGSAAGSPGGELIYHAPSSAYRWAASAHTTPVSHKLHTHHEYSLDAATSSATAANGTSNNMSISLDRGITQSSAVSTHHAMLAVVGPHNTMPAFNSNGDSNNVIARLTKNNANKTVVERTIVKSKHRIHKSVAEAEHHVPMPYVMTNRIQTKYDNNAPPDALFDDRPFRRSKRAIRGSNSSSGSSVLAAHGPSSSSGTHVRRRRRHDVNSGTAAADRVAGEEYSMPVIAGGKIAEISPDLFKGLPRQRQAATLILASSSRILADAGVQCRLLGAPLAPPGRAVSLIYSSTTTSPSDSSNNNSKPSDTEPQLNDNADMISEIEEEDGCEVDDGDVESDGQLQIPGQNKQLRMPVNRRNRSDTFDVSDKTDDEIDKAVAVDDLECIVPNIDENDIGDHEDDDDNLSDREHQVSVMRQRLSSGQVHLTMSSSSSSSSGESTESEEAAASDATVSLSGPSVANLEACCSVNKTDNPAESTEGRSGTSLKSGNLPTNSGTIRSPTPVFTTDRTATSGIAVKPKPATASKLPPYNPAQLREKSRSPAAPRSKYPDERPSGMIASDPARAAAKFRTMPTTSSVAGNNAPK